MERTHFVLPWLPSQPRADKSVDVTAGACFLSKLAREVILKDSKEKGFGVCQEWPWLVKKAGLSWSYIAVDGYEWEDPDRYKREIDLEGYDSWLKKNYLTEDEWLKRVDLEK